MADSVLQLDPRDNVVVALEPLSPGTEVRFGSQICRAAESISAKHKMALVDLAPGDLVRMYGMVVGEATQPIARGGLLSTRNTRHRTQDYTPQRHPASFTLPDPSPWAGRTFLGYHRADGQVGTRNYWLVLPLVFCENRNVELLREAFEEELGYRKPNAYRRQVHDLIAARNQQTSSVSPATDAAAHPIFPNVDGIRFLVHEGGCGGTRQDARALCGLLAGYIQHPNVAGATVLSLGCQNAEISILLEEIRKRDPQATKPVLIFDQQALGLETNMLNRAIEQTFTALEQANTARRAPAPLSKLTVGLKCGGSDGFSGISANPALGQVSDMLAALGGKSILSEFPELCGAEQGLIDRTVDQPIAD